MWYTQQYFRGFPENKTWLGRVQVGSFVWQTGLVHTLGTVQLSLQLGSTSYFIQHEMVVAAVEAPAVIGLDFLRGHGCILDTQKGTLPVRGKVHTCQAMCDMPAIFRISMTETASTGASQTFSASVNGLNAAEDGGICFMKVKNLRIEGSSPSWWYKWTGSRVWVPPDGMKGQDWGFIKSGVWVPQVQSCQGFESLKSRVQVPQVKGSSPSSQWFKSLKSRVQVPQVKGSKSLKSRDQVPQVKGSSPSLLYECNNSSRAKREVWDPAFSWDIILMTQLLAQI